MFKLLISIYEQYITIVKNKGEMIQRAAASITKNSTKCTRYPPKSCALLTIDLPAANVCQMPRRGRDYITIMLQNCYIYVTII